MVCYQNCSMWWLLLVIWSRLPFIIIILNRFSWLLLTVIVTIRLDDGDDDIYYAIDAIVIIIVHIEMLFDVIIAYSFDYFAVKKMFLLVVFNRRVLFIAITIQCCCFEWAHWFNHDFDFILIVKYFVSFFFYFFLLLLSLSIYVLLTPHNFIWIIFFLCVFFVFFLLSLN